MLVTDDELKEAHKLWFSCCMKVKHALSEEDCASPREISVWTIRSDIDEKKTMKQDILRVRIF